MNTLIRPLGNRRLVWFEASNRYLLMEEPAWEVFRQLAGHSTPDEIASWCSQHYGLPIVESRRFVREIRQVIDQAQEIPERPVTNLSEGNNPLPPPIPFSERIYRFAGTAIGIQYGCARAEQMVHPLYAHLESSVPPDPAHLFQLYRSGETWFLHTDHRLIGNWSHQEAHFFRGKVHLEFLNRIYRKTEKDWMAVIHGAAISNGKACILLAGPSGSGKSTAASILMASGYQVLADDYVPLDADTALVFPFPAAISVKSGAHSFIRNILPDWRPDPEWHDRGSGKQVRYLSPGIRKEIITNPLPVLAILFVQYRREGLTEFRRMDQREVVPYLITESWVSPRKENARRFMDWATGIHGYELVYSGPDQLKKYVEKIFQNEKE